MRWIIRWKNGSGIGREDRLERLQRLLEAAAKCTYYRRQRIPLPACPPGREEDLEPWMQRIPPVPISHFLKEPGDFYNWNWRGPSGEPRPGNSNHSQAERAGEPPLLELPFPAPARTVVIGGGFLESGSVRSLPYLSASELHDYAPEILAGPLPQLLEVASAIESDRLRLPCPQMAVVPFSGLKHGSLSEADRDRLWRAFQAPVFEQFRGFGRELLAWECEAHEGLHICADNAIFESSPSGQLLASCLGCPGYVILRLATEIYGRLETEPCPCGHPAPRLVDLRPARTRRAAGRARGWPLKRNRRKRIRAPQAGPSPGWPIGS